MHGEQGALICTAKIVETVPWYDAKLYASTQVVDEARHVEVFARYLDEKLGGEYQINIHLRMLLDDIINDSRWDMTYLGMQIMVEGLALAAFGFQHQMTTEPLLKQLLRYVMSDEARHVAFGVLSLKECYDQMTDAEMKERQEFAFEAAIRMRDRFMQQEVWERMGVNVKDILPLVLADPTRVIFQSMLFSKIVPNCKKLGLLERNDQWLRRRFEEMGVIQFEDWADTGEEYAAFEIGAEAARSPAADLIHSSVQRRRRARRSPVQFVEIGRLVGHHQHRDVRTVHDLVGDAAEQRALQRPACRRGRRRSPRPARASATCSSASTGRLLHHLDLDGRALGSAAIELVADLGDGVVADDARSAPRAGRRVAPCATAS